MDQSKLRELLPQVHEAINNLSEFRNLVRRMVIPPAIAKLLVERFEPAFVLLAEFADAAASDGKGGTR